MELPSLDFTVIYKTYRLDPAAPNFLFLAGKYAALSLLALTTNPEAFGVAYSTEASLSSSDFIKRLSRPNVDVFVCVAHAADLPSMHYDIEHGSWVGMVTQIGPTPKEIFWLRESGAPEPLSDELETKWHQTATWVDPLQRGKGIAKQLIEAAVDFATKSMTGAVRQVRVRAFTGPDNEISKKLYGGLGFLPVGKCTVAEAMLGNGNNMYPFRGRTDWTEELMQARIGVVMEKVVEKRSDLNGVTG